MKTSDRGQADTPIRTGAPGAPDSRVWKPFKSQLMAALLELLFASWLILIFVFVLWNEYRAITR